MQPQPEDAKTLTPGNEDLFGPWAAEAGLRLLDHGCMLSAGQRLGPYLIEARLGKGGMGEVYAAVDARLNRRIALKILNTAFSRDEAWQARFASEARMIANLTHPNICTVHDVGEHQGVDWLVMELLEGETLTSRLERGPLPSSEVSQLALALSSALEYAHTRGVVHRDLKPSNLMLTPWGIKLLDFGIAWDATEAGEVVRGGTQDYEAPEQRTGQPDARSDLYSFGVVLFETLTGRRPTPNDSSATGIKGVDNDLARVVLRCLPHDPARRWQTAAELRQALEATVKHQSARIRRNWIAAGMAMFILAASAAGFTAWSDAHRIRSLAVLPFEAESPDRTPAFFTDQITEDLIGRLRKARGLKVVSFESVAKLRGVHKSAADLARELHVDAIVGGTVRHSADELRLQVTLMPSSGGPPMLKTEQSRSVSEVPRLLSEVSRRLAGRLGVQISASIAEHDATHSVSEAAWAKYARGRQMCAAIFAGRFEGMPPDEASRRAVDEINDSIRLDREFAAAHAALAACLWNRFLVGFDSPSDSAPRIRNAALRAIALDRSLGEPFAITGAIRRDYDWDWESAEADFKTAIRLEPGSALAHTQYAIFLDAMGRFQEGIAEARRGAELDPTSGISRGVVPWSTLAAGDLEAAARQYRTITESHADDGPDWAQLTFVLRKLGRNHECAQAYAKARAIYPPETDHLMDTWLMGEMIVEAGADAAARVAAFWRAEARRRYVDPYNIGGHACCAWKRSPRV
jgi:TolB-like protein/tetratricopeptide (TPR) repeat protein